MVNPLNLYATKVFAEHPISLWALDEQVDYQSLIDSSDQSFADNSDQNLSTWNVVGATVLDAINDPSFSQQPPSQKFPNVPVNGITGTIGNGNFISFTSSKTFQPSELDLSLGTIAVGTYFYFASLPIVAGQTKPVNIAIGYVYENPDDLQTYSVIKSSIITSSGAWAFVSDTFGLPDNFSDLRITIEIAYQGDEDIVFSVNGLSIAQWSEEFHTESLGVVPQTLPLSQDKYIGVSSKGIEALSYGVSDRSGYYLSDGKKLSARNAGLPLVYGAFNSTEIVQNPGKPSLIIPGLGFMNESGKYQNLTLEFWMKVRSNSNLPRRICGPIASTDGLYAEGPFLKLKVGQYSGAHYVGEWDRPMLIDIKLSYSNAELLVNGDEVVSLTIDPNSISYPAFENNTQSLDWIGFYAYEDIPSIKIDCAGIYSYLVPGIVAKKRWVYGQGVDLPTNVQGLNSNNTAFIDYTFANYARNHSYPKTASWQTGISDNLRIEDLYVTSPSYQKPAFYFNNKTESQWYNDIRINQGSDNPVIRMRPTDSWSNTFGYFYFQNLNFLQEDVKSFYGVFKLGTDTSNKETLLELNNDLTGSVFEIYSINNNIYYDFSYLDADGTRQTQNLKTLTNQTAEHRAYVGVDIDVLTRSFGDRLGAFFGNKRGIKVYVGGKRDFSNVFTGDIYSFNFCTYKNLLPIKQAFDSQGFMVDAFNAFINSDIYDAGDQYFGNNASFWSAFLDGGEANTFPDPYTVDGHVASYKLNPKFNLGRYTLDIAASSYWEDYMPLSYFAKYVKDSGGRSFLDLEFMQFNVDYPKMSVYFGDSYNTRDASVKTYISFQPLALGGNVVREYENEIAYLPKNGIVSPGDEWIDTTNKIITKYEVLNDSIVYFPLGIDLNEVAVFFHVEMETDGIETNPVKLRSLQMASVALNQYENKIGTKSGTFLTPYRIYGVFKDHTSNNPFSICKRSHPYLYLSSTSGIGLRGDYQFVTNRYMEFKINKNPSSFFQVGALQFAMRYDEENFPLSPVELFEIEDASGLIKFYLIADSSNQKRGQVYAVDVQTGTLRGGIVYYMDGKVVKRPIVKSGYWSVLGLSFDTSLNFDGVSGAIRFTSPIRFDNISLYQVTAEDQIKQNTFRQWSAVVANESGAIDWDYWASTESTTPDPANPDQFLKEFQWSDVLYFGEAVTISTLDAADIYRKFSGTSRFVVDSDNRLMLDNYRYNVYKDLAWSSVTVDSV